MKNLNPMKKEQGDEHIMVRLSKTQGRFKRARNPQGRDAGIGEFLMLLDITALQQDVYIPISIASGKKPTGFVYQIEGTRQGTISTTDISCRGEKITQVTLGTILYAKIPKGMTASFRILIEMGGQMEGTYSIMVNRINYKFNPIDARYTKILGEIRSAVLKFH